jgi:hypothetical protein
MNVRKALAQALLPARVFEKLRAVRSRRYGMDAIPHADEMRNLQHLLDVLQPYDCVCGEKQYDHLAYDIFKPDIVATMISVFLVDG